MKKTMFQLKGLLCILLSFNSIAQEDYSWTLSTLNSTVFVGLNAPTTQFGDVDGDGDLDLITMGAESSVQKIYLYKNNGSGVFTRTEITAVTALKNQKMRLAHLDTDGKIDMLLLGLDITTNAPVVKIFKNTGSGQHFSNTSTFYAPNLVQIKEGDAQLGDIDNDGDIDIVLSGADASNNRVFQIMKNTGTSFSEFTYSTGVQVTPLNMCGIKLFDFDNDGDLDVLIGGRLTPTSLEQKLYVNGGTGAMTTAHSVAGAVLNPNYSVIDLNNDEKLDVVVTTPNAIDRSVLLSTNISSPLVPNSPATTALHSFVGTIISGSGDFYSNGKAGLILAGLNYSNPFTPTVKVYHNSGASTINEVTSSGISITESGLQNSALAIGDVDNDGDLDLFFIGSGLTKLYLANACSFPLPTSGNVTSQCPVTNLPAPTLPKDCNNVDVQVLTAPTITYPITQSTNYEWIYKATGGLTRTHLQKVVVNDNISPVPNLSTLPNQTVGCAVTSINQLVAPTSTDNCDGEVVGFIANSVFPITTTSTVTWIYRDSKYNISQQQQTIVVSTTNPVPNVASLPAVSSPCAVTSLTAPTANKCGETITGTSNVALPITTNTTITWTYTATDGTTSTQNQNVVIANQNPTPTVTNLTALNSNCAVTSLTAPTATHACAGTITGTHNATFPITSNTTVTWTYAGPTGNTTQTQQVIINTSNPAPSISSLSPISTNCVVTSLVPPTATHPCVGTITGTHNATFPITSNTTVTWTYVGPTGNTTQTQTVNITAQDIVPSITNLPAITSNCPVTSLTAPTATQACFGNLTATHNASLPISANTTVTWTYTTPTGATKTQTQAVQVTPVNPTATIASLAAITSNCAVTNLIAPTATHPCAGTIMGTHNAVFPITSNTTVTWTYVGPTGNTTQTQVVNVSNQNIVPTTITLPTLSDPCQIATLTAPTANQACDGTLTATHNATLPITSSTTVIWTYTASNGQTLSQNQTVTIVDVAPTPTVSTLAAITSNCAITSLIAPTATHPCAAEITGTSDATFPINSNTTVTWTFTSPTGVTSTQVQEINIGDQTIVPVVAELPELTSNCPIETLTAPTATQLCAGEITGITSVNLPIASSTTITWTYTDGNGTVVTQTQEVVIDNPLTFTITQSENTATVTVSDTDVTYQWIDCETTSEINGETQASFTPTEIGSYACIIANQNCEVTTNCITMNFLSIKEINNLDLTVVPNPSITGFFTIKSDQINQEYIVTDLNGKKILTGKILTNETTIDLEREQRGVYLLTIPQSNRTIKLIK